MSADDGEGDPPAELPRVPDIEDPRPSTPLTEDFRTGTANDPPRYSARGADADDGMLTVTVDGEAVAVPEGATLLDAVEAADAGDEVPALCHYDRDTEAAEEIGPRTTCRTCVVETGDGLVPSCSHPAEDGATVRTDAPDAAEARSVNLDLVLSNHNLRCTTCGKNGRCELQDAAIEADVEHPRYGVLDDRSAYEPVDDTSGVIQIDRNKCILCNRCVEACNDVQVEGVLRIETDEDGEPRIGFMSEADTMADSTCVSCGHCATVCPTGSLVESDYADSTTLPIPGFTQKNSVGTVHEAEPVATADRPDAGGGLGNEAGGAGAIDDDLSGVARFMAKAKRKARQAARDAGKRAFLEGEHAAEAVAARTLSEGRLFDIASGVARVRSRDIETTETTCGYCAVGCRFEVHSKDDDIKAVRPTDPDHAPANDFSTCVKGKFGYEFVGSDDRLTSPLVRDASAGGDTPGPDGFREVGWDEAIERVADGLRDIKREHGPHALSAFASSKCTNEEDYLLQKFARAVLETPNVDNCARLCHSSTVAALLQTVGYGAMSNSIDDVANTDCYLITGSNTTESHPVLATHIKRNVRDGATLHVYDPRETGIAEHADQYTRTRPGYDIAWLNGLTRYVIEHDLYDDAFVEEHVQNFEALREKVDPFTPAEVERLAGVSPEDLAETATAIAAADTCVFGWAMGLTQHGHGTRNVLAVANLALVTGHIGKRNAGLSPFRGHNNVQGGGGDMGTLPNKLPGYRDPTDPEVADEFEGVWGTRPPEEVGLKVTETFQAIHEGDVRGLYVMGENPALSEPDIQHAEEGLAELDFLVVQDVFLTETAEHADVVLPAASFAEKDGTFTNTERRVQLVGEAVSPPGDAKPDWEILQQLAREFGHDWNHEDTAEIMDEISEVAPIYGGISHDRIEAEGGLQWPCTDTTDPGTRFLYEDGFNFPDGEARFVPADMGRPGELPDEEYPLTLTTGRVMYHFHTGTLTRRVEGIMRHVGESFVEVNPATAETLGIADGDAVRVASRRGDITVRAQVTDRVGEGVVFVPMHFAEGAANVLTDETYDPTSGIPEYKVASVRIEPVEGPAGVDDLAPDRPGDGTDEATGDD
ncbi:formate dehydrogenase subunit alpha [Haloglomus halophilum]|uniref:formate dehydrogenase subunit alpha n=1 Tax=Haloglomus halophilum TaxID=2962672 RepID=UPI0020C9E3F7|nr:formate dehydrogenase subunit alpha [Haloglomus halophilum]